MPQLSQRVQLFTDSVIRRMTRISEQYGAINLSQGYPDFDPPKPMLDRLAQVAYEGPHQYSITFGAQNLREALADRFYALEVRDHTRMAQDVWARAGEDSLRGLFLRELRTKLQSAGTEEERQTVTRAARFGLAALDHRDLE